LIELAGNLEQQKRLGWNGFSSGWALGSESWRQGLARNHAHRALNAGLEAAAIRDLREARWTEQLQLALSAQSRRPDELVSTKKGEPWKIAIALHLRSQFGVSCHWLSRQLQMGTPDSTRSLLSRARKQQNQRSSP
jgi:hypothetical protein